MTKARLKGVRKVNEMKIKVRKNKWGPLRYIEWIEKFGFGNLLVEDRRTMKNERRTSKNGWQSSRKSPRKRYGSASAQIFFTEPIFFTNFKWFLNYQEAWTKFFFISPPIYRKMGEMLATQLAQASKVTSSRSNRLLEESFGGPKCAWLLIAPPFLLNTPLAIFGESFS